MVGLCHARFAVQKAAINGNLRMLCQMMGIGLINPCPGKIKMVELSWLSMLSYNLVFTSHDRELYLIDTSGPVGIGTKDSIDTDGSCQRNGQFVLERSKFHLPSPCSIPEIGR
jgi:hypothetical protein